MKRYQSKTIEFRRLMREQNLSCRQVAKLLGKCRQTVIRWSCELTPIPQGMLDLLKYRLAEIDKTQSD